MYNYIILLPGFQEYNLKQTHPKCQKMNRYLISIFTKYDI